MAEITVNRDGPYHVKGPLVIKNAQGDTIEATEETWLCRCGHSAKKPFCDGAHKKSGFKE